MSSEYVPNRLGIVPKELYEYIEDALSERYKEEPLKAARRVVEMAYLDGYMDGYRDGHTDAENGHDERFEVILN